VVGHWNGVDKHTADNEESLKRSKIKQEVLGWAIDGLHCDLISGTSHTERIIDDCL